MSKCGATKDLQTIDSYRNPENNPWVVCTLEKDHEGDHVAEGLYGKKIRWRGGKE